MILKNNLIRILGMLIFIPSLLFILLAAIIVTINIIFAFPFLSLINKDNTDFAYQELLEKCNRLFNNFHQRAIEFYESL